MDGQPRDAGTGTRRDVSGQHARRRPGRRRVRRDRPTAPAGVHLGVDPRPRRDTRLAPGRGDLPGERRRYPRRPAPPRPARPRTDRPSPQGLGDVPGPAGRVRHRRRPRPGPERIAGANRSYHPGMAFDDALAERLRDRLRDVAGVHEKKVFGGLAFLTDGNMTMGVHGDDLIVRIAPDDTPTALAEPGVRPFDITGRPMRGWILVAGETLDDDVLDGWIERARTFVATLPPK